MYIYIYVSVFVCGCMMSLRICMYLCMYVRTYLRGCVGCPVEAVERGKESVGRGREGRKCGKGREWRHREWEDVERRLL